MARPAARLGGADLLILGSGALATLFAARLAAAGVAVTLLDGWQEGVRVLEANGAELDGSAFPVHATSDPAECAGANNALVLVKSWQTPTAARQLGECLAPDGIALTLQNGLGNQELLAQVLGEGRVAAGITSAGAILVGPGRAVSGGEGPIVLPQEQRLSGMIALLQRADFQVETTRDLPKLIWSKLAVNAAINPLSALLRVPNGELLRFPAVCHFLDALSGETAAVARAQGIPLEEYEAVQFTRAVVQRTAHNRSSMLQDMERGAPTEVDSINGAVVRRGELCGVPAPLNRVMWSLVRQAG